MTGSRVPPHNLEAEESLLGAMLLSRAAIEAVSESVVSTDFYKPSHGLIYDALLTALGRGASIDAITVAEELRRNKLLEQAGGTAALIALQSNTPAISHAANYAQIIIEKATLRRMISVAAEITEMAYTSSDDVSNVVEMANVLLAEVGNASLSTEPDDISIEEFVDRPHNEVVQWAIHALIRKRHKLMLVGGEGSGKSSILRYVAICAAYGIQPWRHEFVQPIRTLIADFENPEDALYEAFVPILKQAQSHSGIDVADVTDRLWWRPEGINLRNRADMIRFENVIRARRPDLVCVGPLYAMYQNDSKDFGWETAAKSVQDGLKKLMVRYNFALMIEDHAPQDSGGQRSMRPYGSSYWRRWPDIGLGMEPISLPDDSKHFYEDRFSLFHWRGRRAHVDWPDRIVRGSSINSKWYFEGRWGDDPF